VVAEHSYTGWLAFLLRWLTGVPFVIHSHNNEASRFRQMGKPGWKLYAQYERWIHREANFNFFKTEEEKQAAVTSYQLDEKKCLVVPYGIKTNALTAGAKEVVRSQYNLSSKHIFYFNGTLDYTPNRDAVENLVEKVAPLLVAAGLHFTILISGKWLNEDLQQRIRNTETIRYLGFVDDADLLYDAVDLFLNPVVNDSGVKTKVVEALSHHCTVVSTRSGAVGIPQDLCEQKLATAPDGDWPSFAATVLTALQQPGSKTPDTFFTYFAWKNIAQKAAICLDDTIRNAGQKF
jgi:glycosyltransferase involved in cell wall biosynthesis